MRTRILRNAVLVVATTGLCCGIASPQKVANDSTTKCVFSGLYRKAGWQIPGIPSINVKSPRRPLAKDMPGVFATALEPKERQATVLEIGCSPDEIGSLQVEDQPIGVLSLLAFDFAGRTFAYAVRYGTVTILKNGERRDGGMETTAVYYALDGSGRFTLVKNAERPFIIGFVPDWAKRQ